MNVTLQDYFLYLVLTSFLFFFFVIIISIFGMIFVNYLKKRSREKWDINFFEKFILSFGIGLSIYISFYFILGIFRFTNFFTTYLPFIIIDVIFISKLIHNNKIDKEKILKIFKEAFYKKENLILVCILIFIFILEFLFQWTIITLNISLLNTDPFLSVSNTEFLFYNGYLKDFQSFYPPAFEFFLEGCLSLLISPNFQINYFFIKLAPIPLFFFIILVITLIVKKIFKKNYLIFFSLIILLTANFLNLRILYFISSNIATILLLISFIILISNCPFYLIGFFNSIIFLFNPVIGFFYILALSLFVLIKLFYLDKKLKNFLIEILKSIILAGILFLPFIFLLYSYNSNIISLINCYLYQFGFVDSSIRKIQLNNINYLLCLDFSEIKEAILNILTFWLPSDITPWHKRYYLNNTIIFSFFFIFAVMSLFLPIKKNIKRNSRDFIIFGKGIIILVLIFFFLPIIFPNNIIITIIPFWIILRMLECFCAPIILMECFTINIFYNKLKNLTINFVNTLKHFNFRIPQILYKFIIFENIFILILLSTASYNYYNNNQQSDYAWYRNYHYTPEQIETFFFIKENISRGATILVPNFTYNPTFNWIYSLLHDYQYNLWDFSVEDCYNKTKNYLHQNNIKYLLVDIGMINSTQLEYFLFNDVNFKVIYENSRNILFDTTGDLEKFHGCGIFRATWNFIEEKEGDSGYNINFINYYGHSDNCSASITYNVGLHRKVLDLYNHEINGFTSVLNYLGWSNKLCDKVESGTIEFWWRSTDVNQEFHFSLIEDPNNHLVRIRVKSSTFQYYNGLIWVDIKSGILNDTWYQIRIDFECGEGGYEGLLEDNFNLYINGILEDNNIAFCNIGDYIHKIRLFTTQSFSDFHTFFDAFGYSWDYNYQIGNNLVQIYL